MMGPELHLLTTGIGFGESPRWHEGRLWVADWSAREILAMLAQDATLAKRRVTRRRRSGLNPVPRADALAGRAI